MSASTDVKSAIRTLLDELETADVLETIIEDDFKVNFDLKDIPAFPAAILSTPSIESEMHTNVQNLRTYIFEIVVVMKGEDIASTSDVETLMDAIIDKFDNHPTLDGAAHGGLMPSTTSPAPVASADGSFILFTVRLEARTIVDLSF